MEPQSDVPLVSGDTGAESSGSVEGPGGQAERGEGRVPADSHRPAGAHTDELAPSLRRNTVNPVCTQILRAISSICGVGCRQAAF
jgi:hypothetical protein